MAKKYEYDHIKATKLENFVRMKTEYRQQLGIPAMHVYFAISYLEQKGLGVCQPTNATYKQLREAAFISQKAIRPALEKLNGVLCEIKIGTPIKGGKKATIIRRYTLAELISGKASKKIIDHTPKHAKQLAKIMKKRTFVYDADSECNPYWNPTRTGRISSSRPPVQNDPPRQRIANLKRGCGKGESLIHCDIERAEPTVIQHLIGYVFESDPYELAIRLLDVPRREAKKKINSLAYCKDAVRVVEYWPKAAQEAFMPYAEALDSFKSNLWKDTKPKGRARRFVITLGGSKIYAETGGDHHRGTVFNWMAQGTIAEIINKASLHIIDGEEVEGDWRFCFPEHDAVYVIGKKTDAPTISTMIEQAGKEVGINLKVKTEVF